MCSRTGSKLKASCSAQLWRNPGMRWCTSVNMYLSTWQAGDSISPALQQLKEYHHHLTCIGECQSKLGISCPLRCKFVRKGKKLLSLIYRYYYLSITIIIPTNVVLWWPILLQKVPFEDMCIWGNILISPLCNLISPQHTASKSCAWTHSLNIHISVISWMHIYLLRHDPETPTLWCPSVNFFSC